MRPLTSIKIVSPLTASVSIAERRGPGPESATMTWQMLASGAVGQDESADELVRLIERDFTLLYDPDADDAGVNRHTFMVRFEAGSGVMKTGEWAPAHRHTPNAVRLIVEGESAYTTVGGEKCVMQRGDLILRRQRRGGEGRSVGNESLGHVRRCR